MPEDRDRRQRTRSSARVRSVTSSATRAQMPCHGSTRSRKTSNAEGRQTATGGIDRRHPRPCRAVRSLQAPGVGEWADESTWTIVAVLDTGAFNEQSPRAASVPSGSVAGAVEARQLDLGRGCETRQESELVDPSGSGGSHSREGERLHPSARAARRHSGGSAGAAGSSRGPQVGIGAQGRNLLEIARPRARIHRASARSRAR